MSARFPDTETIRAALTLATQAPSVRNSQPWRWQIGPQSLQLFADFSRNLPDIDPDRRDLIISCGAALHHCAVALAALGWHAKIHRFPNPDDPAHLAYIELLPQTPGDVDVTLAGAIKRRRTDRRHYSPRPVPGGDIALMGARAARGGVMLRQIDLLPRLNEIVADAVLNHPADHGYLTELNSRTGRHGSLVGVPVGNAPISDTRATIPARLLARVKREQPRDAPPAQDNADNAIVLALGTAADDDLARLRAGEATSLVLLSATAMGLATCPVTEPLEIPETREAVRADVFGTSGFPQMLLRLGWAAVNAEPPPATPRRPVSEVTGWVEDGTFVA